MTIQHLRKTYLGLDHTGTQSFRCIFVPISGTDKYAVHTGTERLRTNFALCFDGNAIVSLTCLPSACSDGNGTERLRTNFALCFDGNAIVSLTCLPSACSDGNGTERNDCLSYTFSGRFFSHSTLCNGTVLFEAFLSERNPSAFHFSEQHGTKWNYCVPV